MLLSPTTNARGPHSCLVCEVTAFLFIAKGLWDLLLLFSWRFITKSPGNNMSKPLHSGKILQKKSQIKVPARHYAQPPRDDPQSPGHWWLGSAITYGNSLCSYCSKSCIEKRLYSHPRVWPPVLYRVLLLDNCSQFFPGGIISFPGLSRPVGLQRYVTMLAVSFPWASSANTGQITSKSLLRHPFQFAMFCGFLVCSSQLLKDFGSSDFVGVLPPASRGPVTLPWLKSQRIIHGWAECFWMMLTRQKNCSLHSFNSSILSAVNKEKRRMWEF